MKPDALIKRAQTSSFYKKLLNLSLWRIIPFNKPHKIVVHSIEENQMTTKLPFRKSNLNHIHGLHACGMATLAEFTTGLSLLKSLDTKKYRIIMKNIAMEYYYQGKSDSFATFEVTDAWLNESIINPLKDNEKVDVVVKIDVHDSEENHLATGTITWQIKDWEKVKTRK